MHPIIQTADVGRRKPGEPPRQPIKLTLDPEVIKALDAEEERSGAKPSRIVDRAVRAYLKMEQPKE